MSVLENTLKSKYNISIAFRNRKFTCLKCEKKFVVESQLDSHQCKLKYSCDLCNKHFLKEDDMYKHLKDQHDQQYIITFMK